MGRREVSEGMGRGGEPPAALDCSGHLPPTALPSTLSPTNPYPTSDLPSNTSSPSYNPMISLSNLLFGRCPPAWSRLREFGPSGLLRLTIRPSHGRHDACFQALPCPSEPSGPRRFCSSPMSLTAIAPWTLGASGSLPSQQSEPQPTPLPTTVPMNLGGTRPGR